MKGCGCLNPNALPPLGELVFSAHGVSPRWAPYRLSIPCALQHAHLVCALREGHRHIIGQQRLYSREAISLLERQPSSAVSQCWVCLVGCIPCLPLLWQVHMPHCSSCLLVEGYKVVAQQFGTAPFVRCAVYGSCSSERSGVHTVSSMCV